MSMGRQDIARITHEANRAYCLVLGDLSQEPWEHSSLAQRESVIAGVRFLQEHPFAQPADAHQAWCDHKLKEGWKYGPEKDWEEKTHPNLRPFVELPEVQRGKDTLFHAIVRALSVIALVLLGHATAFAKVDCDKFPQHAAAFPRKCGDVSTSSTSTVTTSTTTTTAPCGGLGFGKACGAPVGAEDFDPFVTLIPGDAMRCVVLLENGTCDRTFSVEEIGDVVHHVLGDELASAPGGPLPPLTAMTFQHDTFVDPEDIAFRCAGDLGVCDVQGDCPPGDRCIGFCADQQRACLPDAPPAPGCVCVGVLPDTGFAVVDGAMEAFPGGIPVQGVPVANP